MAIDIKDEFDAKAAEELQKEMEQNEIQPDADTVETQDGEDPIAGEEEEALSEEESEENEKSEEDEKADRKAKKSRFKADRKQDALNEKINELEDKVKRQMAEFDNFRKRTDKEKNTMFETGARSVIEKILPVVDNFERGLASIPDEEKGTPFAEGMEMIYKQLTGELEKMEVKPIPAVGEKFDPNLHNAVMQVESDEYEPGVIAQELQKGYTYRGSVVRHSMVAVVP